jgi:hypothetical protein
MGSGGGLAKERLDFAPHHFDGVEVWRIGWQEEHLGTGLPDQPEDLLVFVGCEVVHEHDVAGAKEGEEDLAHISLEEDTGVGRTFDGHGGGGAVEPHGSKHGGGAPMSVGAGKAQATDFGATTAQAGHVRFGRRFVEEDQARGIEARLEAFPEAPLFGDIGAVLLAGVERLFLYASPCG